jgi:5-deoxy-5-amino-3-dehydroquinate dehydratase
VSEILLLNGPNLSILGRRQPEIYGHATLTDIEALVAGELKDAGWTVAAHQHDSEGDMIRTIQDSYGRAGAIVNPGALMMAGWSLRDALANFPRPWIEVHLSNLWAREQFRHQSILGGLASGVIFGLGAEGYRLAARALVAAAA